MDPDMKAFLYTWIRIMILLSFLEVSIPTMLLVELLYQLLPPV